MTGVQTCALPILGADEFDYQDRAFMAVGPAIGVNIGLTQGSALFLTARMNTPWRQTEGTQAVSDGYESVSLFSGPSFYDFTANYRFGSFSLDYTGILYDGLARHQAQIGFWFDPF